MKTIEQEIRERDIEVARLTREARARDQARSLAYYSKPAPVMTEEQRRAHGRKRREVAEAYCCKVSDVVWLPHLEAWSCR